MATYLITGANRGIGFEYCKQLVRRGDKVIAVCRSSNLELEKLGVQVESGVELTSSKALDDFVKKMSGSKIDVLINNAGILERNSLSNLDPESIRRQFEVNALSPLCFSRALLNNLKSGSKIILMTSRMGSIEDNSSGGSYGYRMSKVALCMAAKSMSIDLKSDGITVVLLHPGLVSTGMTGFNINGISPEDSVSALLDRIDSFTIEDTGSFWHANGEELPW